MRWVELDISPAGGNPSSATRKRDALIPVLRELQAHPGRWAELDRYPVARITSARSRGSNIAKRHAGIEYAVLPIAGEAVLYLRADPAYDVHTADSTREAQP